MNKASEAIDVYLQDLPDWQRNNLIIIRKIVHEIAPTVEKQWKWDVYVFALNGEILFVMPAFKANTKYNFIANGAKLIDAENLFNNGLESKKSRSIVIRQDGVVNESGIVKLIEQSIKSV